MTRSAHRSPRTARPPAVPASTVPELLDARAAEHPDRLALQVVGGGSVSYGLWRDRALRAAVGLAEAGVRPGARVALRFRNDAWDRFAVAFLAVQYAGGVPVPVREDLAEPEAARLVALAEAGTVLRDAAGEGAAGGANVGRAAAGDTGALPGTVDLLLADLLTKHQDVPAEPPYRVGPLDEAQVIGTSGTTGAPKGVLAAHGNLTAGLTLNPRPRPYAHSRHALHAFPLGTNAGQVMLLNALTGAPATLVLPRFDAERFGRTVQEFKVGTVFLVPSMAVELLNAGTAGAYDLSSVLLVSSSAAALPGPVATALAAALPGATLVNTYTSAESAPAQISAIVDTRHPGSVGRPADPADLRILDAEGRELAAGEVGEVWLRQPGPPRGYLGAGAGAADGARVFRDGWVRMGDLGRVDDGGRLYLVDRESDVIKSGALKVSTLRIEEVLHEHPRVADAAALGLPHPVMGAVPVAVVVPGPDGLDLDALRLFLSARLSRPELPLRIVLADRLPKNPTGKVVKHLLRPLFDAPPEGASGVGSSGAGAPGAAAVAPASPTETRLAAIWRGLLGRTVTDVAAEFFALGGDSFRAVQLAAALEAEFGVRAGTALIFERPSLRAQAAWLDAGAAATRGNGDPAAVTAPATVTPYLTRLRAQPHAVPLSSQQENFFRWMAEAPGRDAGAVTALFRVTDRLEPGTLGRALTEAVRRHPALRTRFEPVAGEPGVVRVVLDEEPNVRVTLREAPGASDAEVDALLLAERDRLTDLARDPMARLLVVTRGPEDHVVLLAVHHMVADGWSVGVLLSDLGVLYSALRRGRTAPPVRPGPGYRELVEWSNAHWPASRRHFAGALAGAPAAVEVFPGRGEVAEVLTQAHRFDVPAGLAEALRARAGELGATPFLAVTAAWAGLLAARSGQSELVLMSPVPGRPRPDAEHAVGCFVQSLLLRVDASGSPGFAELLDRLRVTATEALDHQLYPFAEFSPAAPFAAWLRYEAWTAPPQLPGVRCAPWELPRGTTVPWPLPGGDRGVPELTVVEQPGGRLRCWLQYNGLAFDASVIAALAEEFVDALRAATATA
ncbi:AMP-binding protein [Streptomyces liangshanensis]|uniref:AMP-binding protein n=1 Tax=Streptomyces liangshanensis TaxID=2717324 RepID=A0A6G9H8F3_9ACTN|nr:class I adenylate-forming enzyme family protein [Streptomyces liangshanensis]QIQ06770.1 AMP-binding protein [Streptomyces liangshanensis]